MARRNTLLIAFLVGAPIAIGVAVKWMADRLLPSACANEVVHESSSPDAVHRAVVFRRDCGATTGFSTQVSILRQGASLPDRGGNLLALDGEQEITATWTDASHVVIAYPQSAPLLRQSEEVDGVLARLTSREPPASVPR